MLSHNFFTTSFALVAFAANSVICRLALGEAVIDPASFTAVRLISGGLVLGLVVALQSRSRPLGGPKIKLTLGWAPAMLFIYAVSFSYAYTELNTATGALILFGTVQLYLIGYRVIFGHSLAWQEWLGIVIAIMGFLVLMLPSFSRPSTLGFLLMSLAGVAWAMYTLEGKKSERPTADTAGNFLVSIPFALILFAIGGQFDSMTWHGFWLAVSSGAVASGIGYAVWYLALKNLSVTQAAVAQLSVPVIAAIGGVLFVAELITMSLAISTLLVLGGIALVTFSPIRENHSN